MKYLSPASRAAYAALLSFFSASGLCSGLLVAVGAGKAPAEQPRHAFDVATIKPTSRTNPPPPSVDISPDRFQATGMTLKELIKVAWNLNYAANDQVAGGPPWVSSTRFDLDAKEDAALSAEIASLSRQQQGDQVRQMLRDLITQRFHLQLHHETRQLAVYDLVVAKSGPKLLPAADPATVKDTDKLGKPTRWIRIAGVGDLEGYSADISTLVTVLSMQPEVGGRLVLDKTGLTGNYDFTLKWTPDIFLSANERAANAGPSLFTALQEELGLHLESAKAPVDQIVIDSVTPPAAN
ncbi:MAG TPA: TIGR03435 family protein [Acidobacteriaceae bacterium]|nr:TIGR03435 family protein [Acidobacteriaceae bacterium]